VRENDSFKARSRALRKKMTDAEHILWYYLRNRQFKKYKFRRQYVLEPYIVDFICTSKMLIIELDGGQHCDNKSYDMERTHFLTAKGYEVVRFWNHDVLVNIEDVLDAILNSLTPTLSRC
jgi:very-short-patch-repair endonuclease